MRNGPLHTPNDSSIAESVRSRLDLLPNWRIQDLSIVVEAGQVTLSGAVSYEVQRRFAEAVARRSPGVVEVRNQIRTLPPPTAEGFVLQRSLA